MEEKVCGLIQGIISAFAPRFWRKTQKPSVRAAGLRTEIWAWDIINIKRECKPLVSDVRCIFEYYAMRWVPVDCWNKQSDVHRMHTMKQPT
jgi:hypothetical protein